MRKTRRDRKRNIWRNFVAIGAPTATVRRLKLALRSTAAKATTAKAAPKKAAAAKKEPAKRKSRAKSAKEVRLKAFWGVFNQSLKRVALYEFSQKKEADKKAKELTASGKSPHFVQPVKEPVAVE